MFKLNCEDKVFILGVLLFGLLSICFYGIATNLCDILEIPYDLSLTPMSMGFRANLILILSLFSTIALFKIAKIISNFIFDTYISNKKRKNNC